jgi:hypothetical protein
MPDIEYLKIPITHFFYTDIKGPLQIHSSPYLISTLTGICAGTTHDQLTRSNKPELMTQRTTQFARQII